MRKLLMIVTMLLVPTLASAWTLPVKVTNTSAGITAGNKAVVVVGTTATTVTTGTQYFYPATTVASVYVTVYKLANLSSITLNGAAVTPTPGGTADTGVVTIPKANLQSLNIVYAAAVAAPKRNITLTQVPNGLTSLAVGQASTAIGFTNVAVGTVATVKAQPNTGYAVRKIYANGTFKIYSTNAAGAASAPGTQSGPFAVTTASPNTVLATYVKLPVISATLSLPTTGTIGTAVTATVAASTTGTAALTYAWTVNGVAAGTAATCSITPVAGANIVYVTVSSTGAASVTKTATIQGIASVSANSDYVCTSCHAGSTPVVVSNYNSSAYKAAGATCQSCHTPTPHAAGGVFTATLNHRANGKSCDYCHSDSVNQDAHKTALPDGCINCHAVEQNSGEGFVQDNNGVRAITTEFAKRSHHVTGRAVKNSDCAVCHLEGKKSGTTVVVDRSKHMADAKTHLRNGNVGLISSDAEFAWDPAAPDNTLMDNFCFSCHNAAGAPTAAAALAGVTGYNGTALNPFDDSVTNDYDQVSRINVVGVYEQFDTGNSSHHAVRGARYTAKTLDAATFTNISTANMAFGAPVSATKNWTAAPIKGIKPLIGTMSSLNTFTATYTTLDGTALADNITIHCGDCHTVGQFRAADVNVKPFNKAVIGAHGSGNEYMLRNSNGDDTLAKDALVCYICHNLNEYGSAAPFLTARGTLQHNNANPSNGHCNSDLYNSAGLDGIARLVLEEGTIEEEAAEIPAGTFASNGSANIFAIKCLNCHNSSDKKTFGGIHGNAGNASYNTYSGAKLKVTDATVVVSRKPYRFMPGLGNFRYNGGDNTNAWMVKTVSSYNKQSCYTLNGNMASLSRTVAKNAGTNINTATQGTDALGNKYDDNGILGSWGACTDHAGTSVQGGMHDPARTILRPLTY